MSYIVHVVYNLLRICKVYSMMVGDEYTFYIKAWACLSWIVVVVGRPVVRVW